jgi:hypothetical protein
MHIAGISIDIIWIAAGGAALLLLLILIIVLAGSGKRNAKKDKQLPKGMTGLSVSLGASPTLAAKSAEAAPIQAPKAAQAAARPAAPADPNVIEGYFGSLAGWVSSQLQAPPAQLSGGAYVLNPYEGVLSAEKLPANAGDSFLVDYAVKIVCAPTNNVPGRYVVGACFANASGEVLSWGSIEGPLDSTGRTATIEQVAPEGTAQVRLCITGYWANEPPAPDGQIAFTKANLRRSVVSE